MRGRHLILVGLVAGLIAFLAVWALLGGGWSESGTDGIDATRDVANADDPGSTGEEPPSLRGHPAAKDAGATRRPPALYPLPMHDPRTPPQTAARAKADAPPKEAVVRIVLGEGETASGRATVRRMGKRDPGEPDGATYPIGGDGTVRVPLKRNSFLDIDVHGRQARRILVSKRDADEPVDVVFGTGEVYGVVRDEQGAPDVGVGVRLSTHLERVEEGWAPSAEGHVFAMATLTDEEGAYRFTGLPTGSFVLVATRRKGDPEAERNIRSARVTLDVGERVQVDFGGVDVEPMLSGVLRYTDGVPVRQAVNMFLTAEEGGGRLYVRTDAQGGFSKRVPPGVYGVEMVIGGALMTAGWIGARLVPTSVRVILVDEYTPPQDITFPGTRIEGRLPSTEKGDGQMVTATLVEPEGEAPVSRITGQPVTTGRAYVEADGTFRLDGLSPGRWRLTGAPRALRPVEVVVDARTPVLPMDMELMGE